MIEIAALFATACLFGGMLLYSFGFAPLLFSHLPGEQAGTLLRNAFPWYYLFVLVLSLLSALLLWPLDGLSAGLMLGVLISGLAARQLLMPAINTARDAQLAGDAAARRRFARLHGASVGIQLLQIVAAAWVLVRFT